MADEKDIQTSNETNEENDAREEDIVRDTDADTQDIETEVRDSVQENEARFARLESNVERILGEIASIREAQGVMVENGAVIQEPETDIDFTDADSFVPPAEMDLLI